MKIDINDTKKHSRTSLLMSKARLVAGFTLAPTMGALGFYILFNIPVFFGFKFTGISLSKSPSFLIGGLMTAGTLFYAPTVIIGLIVMLLVHRYRSWNIVNCIVGGLISAFILSMCFMVLLLLVGSGFAVAGGSFLMMLGLITLPSALAGMSFWVMAAYRNASLEHLFAPHANHNLQPVTAGNAVDISVSASLQPGNDDDKIRLKADNYLKTS